jgi:hypothetical protein
MSAFSFTAPYVSERGRKGDRENDELCEKLIKRYLLYGTDVEISHLK